MGKYNLKEVNKEFWKKGRRWTADFAWYAVSILRGAASGVRNRALTRMGLREPYFAEEDSGLYGLGLEHVAADCLSSQARRIPASAQQIICHKVDLLGSGIVDISIQDKANRMEQGPSLSGLRYRQINWHRDFPSGYEWHRLCMPRVTLRTYQRHAGVDVKWPWELSRFQHLTPLPQAGKMASFDRADGTDVFWQEFRCQTCDWITANPVGLGVNWACEMEVAIRAVNWVVALVCFGRQVDSYEAWSRRFWGSVREHGRFLYKRLRRFGDLKRGNHCVAELAGLCLLGLLCPHITESPQWLYFARQGLEREIRGQVQSDGTHWEDSTFYHLLVTEMFLYTGVIADSLDRPFSSTYRRIVEKMVSVISLISSSRYAIPQIGDSDGGYFIKPVNVDVSHTRAGHVIALGRSYSRCDHRQTVNGALAAILVIGEQESPSTKSGPNSVRGMPVLLEDSGWVVLEQGPIKVIMCLGPPNIEQRGGHAHEDALSISLFWGGVPVVVDPGAYVYTGDPKARNRFRSANCHNQLQIKLPEEVWINRGVFAPLPVRQRVEWEQFSAGSDRQGIVARLESAGDDIRYVLSRKVVLDAVHERLTIEDTFRADTVEILRVAVCLHPDVSCNLDHRGVSSIESSGVNLDFESQGHRFVERQGEYSSSYGCLHKTSWLVWEQRSCDATVVWGFHEKQVC